MRTPPFQLPDGGKSRTSRPSPFAALGFSNPFPASGVSSGVFYPGHVRAQLATINAWLADTHGGGIKDHWRVPYAPLALYGSIGVGKTHLLNRIREGLQAAGHAVTSEAVTSHSTERLQLSSLLLQALPVGHTEQDDGASPLPLLNRIVSNLRSRSVSARKEMLEHLGDESLLRNAILKVLEEQNPARARLATRTVGRWLQRVQTTPAERNRVGLAQPLGPEGQSIRALVDLQRLGFGLGVSSVLYLLIDQLEEIWRAGVLTDVRRARFLTDLRLLIDFALEGAPIAVLLAWNTEASTNLQGDYKALWTRLGQPVQLPGLPAAHLWPFAQCYLDHAQQELGSSQLVRFRKFAGMLQEHQDSVRELVIGGTDGVLGRDVFSLRRTLQAWHRIAEAVASSV